MKKSVSIIFYILAITYGTIMFFSLMLDIIYNIYYLSSDLYNPNLQFRVIIQIVTIISMYAITSLFINLVIKHKWKFIFIGHHILFFLSIVWEIKKIENNVNNEDIINNAKKHLYPYHVIFEFILFIYASIYFLSFFKFATQGFAGEVIDKLTKHSFINIVVIILLTIFNLYILYSSLVTIILFFMHFKIKIKPKQIAFAGLLPNYIFNYHSWNGESKNEKEVNL